MSLHSDTYSSHSDHDVNCKFCLSSHLYSYKYNLQFHQCSFHYCCMDLDHSHSYLSGRNVLPNLLDKNIEKN
ncbi:hypothetical protein X975_07378, partial [Stegodyphus mimosarum]